MIVAIDGLMHIVPNKGSKAVLYLPEDELHEIPLLFVHYVLKSRGYQVVYLGQSVPLNDLISIIKVYQPDMLFSVFTSQPDAEQLNSHIEILTNKFPDTRLYVTGYQVGIHNLASKNNLIVYKEMADLLSIIQYPASSN
jgi:methanogenic corrinoid protein MtbC1